ncbi:MAG: hypothetical protein A2X49_04640 [Lentisphaerae bacterium GWF2_52_8]|nr:MAG: hypothetical protein A2X49_04640 [Lentisphaerae bacterium GWF2_52_8]
MGCRELDITYYFRRVKATTGRLASETNALGKATIYTYNSMGQVATVGGDASYPLNYLYDDKVYSFAHI